MKEITHIVYSNSGGAGHAAIYLSHFLKKNGYKSDVYYLSNHDNLRFFKYPVIYLSSLIDNFLIKKISYTSFFSIIRGRIGSGMRDMSSSKIIHIHWAPGIINLKNILYLLNDKNLKIVITLHDTWFFTGGCHFTSSCELFSTTCNNCPKIFSLFHSLIQKNFSLKEKIASHPNVKFVAPSQWMVNMGEKSSILREKNITLIPNLPNSYAWQSNLDQTTYSFKNVSNKNLNIGFLANNINEPRKNLAFLLQTLPFIEEHSNSKVTLNIAGKGRIRRSFFSSDFEINFFGYLNSSKDLNDFFNNIDILAVPSLEDNSPLVAADAAERRVPIIARRGTGLDELIRDQVSGYLYTSREEFINIIRDLLNNKSNLKAMGDSLNFDYLSMHSSKKILDLYRNIYT